MLYNDQLIYMDYNATTPTDPRVVEAMLPYFYNNPGNAASHTHALGWMAEEAVDQARQKIADLIHVTPEEIVFTSGATESDNLALKGVFEMYHRKGKHIITLKSEHNAVLDTCHRIEKLGGEVTYLDVDEDGLVDLKELEESIRPDTILVSIMWANNETGVIQPMEAIGKICTEKNTLLMSDATQAVGKIKVDPIKAGVHLMAFTGHKMYGPKGIGALYVRKKNPRVKITPQIDGGGHESGMRSGTLNVPAIVGFGKAAEIALNEMEKEAKRISKLRDHLEAQILEKVEETSVNGSLQYRLPHVSNIAFKHVESEGLMMSFNKYLAVSSGSACTSAQLDPSHVLLAMGMSKNKAHSSLRFSLGKFTTPEQVETAIQKVMESVEHARSISPIWMMFKKGIDLDI
ncbi:MAG: IscS subfamily cysteine desulfurase [Bacteroidota bacterium]